jgi:hypothetical protein
LHKPSERTPFSRMLPRVIGSCAVRNLKVRQSLAYAAARQPATRYAVPTLYRPDFAAPGGLMGLAAPVAEQWRDVGTCTGRVLKGDLPVSDPPGWT